MHYVVGLCTFLSPMPFSLVNFHKYDKVCRDLCSVRHGKTCYSFSKSVKQKSNFSQTFEWQEILRRKANKSYDKTAVWNGLEYKTKKIVNLILKNAMLKAIIKVYSELLVTNFYAQISCSLHSKFVKIITILSHLSDCAAFVYVSFPA